MEQIILIVHLLQHDQADNGQCYQQVYYQNDLFHLSAVPPGH